jgi:hypothetical protein
MKVDWRGFVARVLIVGMVILAVGLVLAANEVPWSGQEATSFIGAVAQLLGSVQWLLVVLAIALLYRDEIRKLIPRITNTKILGSELTIGQEISESATASALIERLTAFEQRFDRVDERFTVIDDRLADVLELPAVAVDSGDDAKSRSGSVPDGWYDSNPLRIREAIRLVREGHPFGRSPEPANDPVAVAQERVLRVAADSPLDALVMLTDSIRAELYGIAELLGRDTDRTPAKVAEELANLGFLDPLTVDALKKYWAARSAAYHVSREEGTFYPLNEDIVLDTLDSGLVLLRVLGEQRKDVALALALPSS